LIHCWEKDIALANLLLEEFYKSAEKVEGIFTSDL
jgi:hypothetical protein